MPWVEPLKENPRYQSIRNLSKGGRNVVQLALDRLTGEQVAIKFTQRGWDAVQSKYLLRELLVHQELSAACHPHIVQLKDVFLTPLHLGAVMEHVDGEDLQTFLTGAGGKVSEPLARFLFQQLVLALDFCHSKNKVSRGVKLSNTLLALVPGQLPLLKLADFGYSKDVGRHSPPRSQVGTALFVAPEVMHNFNNVPYDGTAVDVWAAGIVLFILLFGRHPFLRPEDAKMSEQQQMLALFQRTAASQFCLTPQEARVISPGCASLLAQVLQTAPVARATMSQVQAHPWFQTGLPEGAATMNRVILADSAARSGSYKYSPQDLAAVIAQGQVLDSTALAQSLLSASAPAVGAAGPQPLPVQASAGRLAAPVPAALQPTQLPILAARQQYTQDPQWQPQQQQQYMQQPLQQPQSQQFVQVQQQPQQPNNVTTITPSAQPLPTQPQHAQQQSQYQQWRQQQQQEQNDAQPPIISSSITAVSQPMSDYAAAAAAGPKLDSHLWQPHLAMSSSATSSSAHSAANTAGVSCGATSSYHSSRPQLDQHDVNQQQQQQQQLQDLHLQTQQQGSCTPRLALQLAQQQQAVTPAAGGAPPASSGMSFARIYSADLEALIPLDILQGNIAAATATAVDALAAGPGRITSLTLDMFGSMSTLPFSGAMLQELQSLDAQNNILQEQQQQERQQQAVSASQQQQQQQTAPTTPISSSAAASGSSSQVAASIADTRQSAIEIPDEYAPFLVDEEEYAAVTAGDAAGNDAAATTAGLVGHKRLRSYVDGGFSSWSLDLKQLSELLAGASQVALMENSMWHKVCREVSFRGTAQLGGSGGNDSGGDGATAAGGADSAETLVGLQTMSILQVD